MFDEIVEAEDGAATGAVDMAAAGDKADACEEECDAVLAAPPGDGTR